MQDSLDRIAPEGPHYRHADEGSDDMPAHVKVLLGCNKVIHPAMNAVKHPIATPYLGSPPLHVSHAVACLHDGSMALASLRQTTVHVLCSLR